MQLIRRLRTDESGAALITALLCTMVMLALGIALLSIVDTQANQSGAERTRDHAFNLAESVLNSEAFVLGRNWPDSAPGANPACNAASAGFGALVGATATANSAVERLRPNLNESYTDAAYANASWQVNICDDVAGSAVWDDANLVNKAWDANGNQKVWVRAQSTVGGKTRALVGLVKVRQTPAVNPKWGLVSGSVADDLGPVTSALTNNSLVTALTNNLINSNPPVAADAAYPVPASGVTGLRCGLLDNVNQVKTCVTGAIGALASVPAVNNLVTNGRFEQFPTTSSTSPDAIGQMRSYAKASSTYVATTTGASSAASAPACTLPAAASSSTVVFIEQVGNGDDYCTIDVSTSKAYRALVIGSGRVVIRGSNTITDYATTTANRLTAVVYALNLQTSDQTQISPTRELVRIEKGARVTGAVHADGKNARVNIVAPDFDTTALVNGLLCPGALCVLAPTLNGLLGTLGVSGTVNALINGTCLVSLPLLGCTVSLPGLGLNTVVGGITAQLSTYGSAIHSDVATINAFTVYGASGVASGTFRDLQPR